MNSLNSKMQRRRFILLYQQFTEIKNFIKYCSIKCCLKDQRSFHGISRLGYCCTQSSERVAQTVCPNRISLVLVLVEIWLEYKTVQTTMPRSWFDQIYKQTGKLDRPSGGSL